MDRKIQFQYLQVLKISEGENVSKNNINNKKIYMYQKKR